MPLTRIKNLIDVGTEGTKVANGTTAQRGSTTGQLRFNSTTGKFEGRNTSNFFSLEPIPTITSVDDTEVDSASGGNQTIVVTGTNFSSGGTIAFVGSTAEFNATTTTFDSATQVTAVAPKSSFLNAQEPYKVKFTSSTGVSGTSSTGLINVDNAPTWSTASGQVGGLIYENSAMTNTTLTATDTDNDTIAYSIQSGALPTGISLNSSTGVLSGTPTASITADTTYNFTARATANSKTADRAFNIVVKNTNTGFHTGKADTMSGGTAWFNSSVDYYGVQDDSNAQFTSGDLITQWKIRGSSTNGTQNYWFLVMEQHSTEAQEYYITAGWRFQVNSSDGTVFTLNCADALDTVGTLLNNNAFVIPSSSTGTNGNGNYYIGWVSSDSRHGGQDGSIYVDASSGGNIDYKTVSSISTVLGITNAFPDNIETSTNGLNGTPIDLDDGINTGTNIHINARST